jgi:hypothetical protein
MYEASDDINRFSLDDLAAVGPVFVTFWQSCQIEHEQSEVFLVRSEQPRQDQAEFFSQAQL